MSSFQIGRLTLGPPAQWYEQLGDPVTTLGGAAVPNQRTAPQYQATIATWAADGQTDSPTARYVLRRAIRSMFNNSPLKFQAFLYAVYSDDPEQNGWYVPDQSSLQDYSGSSGLATGLWNLSGQNWYVAGRRRTHREARSVWMKDLRTGLYARDALGWILSADFAGLPLLQLSTLANGASQAALTVTGQVVPLTTLPSGRDGGTCLQCFGLGDLQVTSYERAESAFNLSDVIVYDRRGNLGPFGTGTASSVAAGNATTGNGTTVTAPSGLANGNLIIVACDATSAPSAPSGWTTLVSDSAPPNGDFYVFYKIANNEPASWTFSGGIAQWVCGVWTGVNTTTPINASGVVNATTGSGTVTTTVNGCAILTVSCSNSNTSGAWTYPAACTVQGANPGATAPVAIGYDTGPFQMLAGVTTSRTVTNANSANSAIATIAVAPATPYVPAGSYDSPAGLTSPTSAYGWEEVYGPDYPWSWTTGLAANDTPVIENGLVRVRWDTGSGGAGSGAGTCGFRVDVWTGATYSEQGKINVFRTGDSNGFCNTWIAANLVEWTPERAVMCVVLANSSDGFSRERVYVTVQRGELGITFECYPGVKANGTSQADTYFLWTPALNSGAADLNNSILKIDSPGATSTTITAGSSGVNVNTFAGAGVLNVTSTTGFATAGELAVPTSNGFALITYTGTTSTTFTGCGVVGGVTSGTLAINNSVAPAFPTTWTAPAAGAGQYAATAGTGAGAGNSGQFSTGALTLGATSFSNSENWAALLRFPTTYNVVAPYQCTFSLTQAVNAICKYQSSSTAYGSSQDAYQISSQNGAGYMQCQVQFGATQAQQVMEAESMTLGTGTSSTADASASGGTAATAIRTTDANAHVTQATWPNSFNATYRCFIRAKVSAGTGSFYVKTGATTGTTVTTTSTTYVWLDCGEITANASTLEIHAWITSGTVSVDRFEAVLTQDRARTNAIYSGSRDGAQAALADSRMLGALVTR